MTSEQRPACSKCQTPMVRYNVPHTGDKEQAWRLVCSCKHSAVNEVVPSNLVLELRAMAKSSNMPTSAAMDSLLLRAAHEIERQHEIITDKEADCIRLHKQFMDLKYPDTASPDETNGEELSREVETLAAELNAVWSHCRVVFYPPMDDPRGNYPLEHTNAARKDMRAIIEQRLSEITKRPAVEPSPAHTTEQDFQHWLSYSGMRYSFKHVATEPELRIAYYAGADVAPPKSAGCPTHGMEHFFEGMCIKCGVVPAVNGTGEQT